MKYDYTLTGYLASGNGGSWLYDKNKGGFLSPIVISRLKISPNIGDKVSVETDERGSTTKVWVNDELAFEGKKDFDYKM